MDLDATNHPHKHYGVAVSQIINVNPDGSETVIWEFDTIIGRRDAGTRSACVIRRRVDENIYLTTGTVIDNDKIHSLN